MRRRRSYYHDRKDRGLCTNCGARPPVPGKTRCLVCAAVQSKYDRKLWLTRTEERSNRLKVRYYKLKAAGHCVTCGIDMQGETQVQCTFCRERSFSQINP